eukprot:4676240-Prymnesium_polylepis.1
MAVCAAWSGALRVSSRCVLQAPPRVRCETHRAAVLSSFHSLHGLWVMRGVASSAARRADARSVRALSRNAVGQARRPPFAHLEFGALCPRGFLVCAELLIHGWSVFACCAARWRARKNLTKMPDA